MGETAGVLIYLVMLLDCIGCGGARNRIGTRLLSVPGVLSPRLLTALCFNRAIVGFFGLLVRILKGQSMLTLRRYHGGSCAD